MSEPRNHLVTANYSLDSSWTRSSLSRWIYIESWRWGECLRLWRWACVPGACVLLRTSPQSWCDTVRQSLHVCNMGLFNRALLPMLYLYCLPAFSYVADRV